MRALIVILSAVVVALAVLILLSRPPTLEAGPTFDATALITDAARNERAVYRDEGGNTLTYTVEMAVPGGVDREPLARILVAWRDRTGKPVPWASARYEHRVTRHGFFPLMAPGDPEGYDRVWIWTRISRARLTWRGRARMAWRVDLIDPALPRENDADHVVAWLDPSVPVYGLLRWQRGGRTWTLVDWNPK
ncbi:MAG: hypothetical protein ACC662_02005 [Planctomycetota bacterium]